MEESVFTTQNAVKQEPGFVKDDIKQEMKELDFSNSGNRLTYKKESDGFNSKVRKLNEDAVGVTSFKDEIAVKGELFCENTGSEGDKNAIQNVSVEGKIEIKEEHFSEVSDNSSESEDTAFEGTNQSRDGKLFECKQCNFSSKYKHGLQKHIGLQHKVYSEVFACNVCSYTAKRKSELTRHVRIKHDESSEPFRCDCGFSTSYKGSYLRHIQLLHNKENREEFVCNKCSYKTKLKAELLKHARIKHDEDTEVYACTTCDFKSSYKSCLAKHIQRWHSKDVDK